MSKVCVKYLLYHSIPDCKCIFMILVIMPELLNDQFCSFLFSRKECGMLRDITFSNANKRVEVIVEIEEDLKEKYFASTNESRSYTLTFCKGMLQKMDDVHTVLLTNWQNILNKLPNQCSCCRVGQILWPFEPYHCESEDSKINFEEANDAFVSNLNCLQCESMEIFSFLLGAKIYQSD